jgi:hypothetical protein
VPPTIAGLRRLSERMAGYPGVVAVLRRSGGLGVRRSACARTVWARHTGFGWPVPRSWHHGALGSVACSTCDIPSTRRNLTVGCRVRCAGCGR